MFDFWAHSLLSVIVISFKILVNITTLLAGKTLDLSLKLHINLFLIAAKIRTIVIIV